MNLLLCVIALGSAQFLRLTPGVVAQAMGGSSVVIHEGLPTFHNPAQAQDMTFNFTLARWLYATNHLTAGATYRQYLFGVTYLNYGQISGYDSLGNPTAAFTPYDLCLAAGRRFGLIGVALKGFNQRIEEENLVGLCGMVGIHYSYQALSIGLKVDNLGKEFTQNTTIPAYIALGFKYNVARDLELVAEAKSSPIELNSGIRYAFQSLSLLAGIKYLRAEDLVAGSGLAADEYDLFYSGGILVRIEEYSIGYSVVYNPASIAHQFSVTLTPGLSE